MQVFLNDRSLNGQFKDEGDFYQWVKTLLALRDSHKKFSGQLYCNKNILDGYATATMTVREVVKALKSRDFQSKVILWLSRSGPFIPAQINPSFICEHENEDVTDSMIGYMLSQGLHKGIDKTFLLSFSNSNSFDYSPLKLSFLSDDCNEEFDVSLENIFDLTALQKLIIENDREDLVSNVQFNNWQGLLDCVVENYEHVELTAYAFNLLVKEPFSEVICKSAIGLIKILNDFIASRDSNGNFSSDTNELIRTHFSGGGAKFTDESKTNKQSFKKEMTFKLGDMDVFCPWHGKISHDNFRIHFTYPLSSDQNKIIIVYIGPKITKK